jgi:single-stranded-DNA-specific exonuclease
LLSSLERAAWTLAPRVTGEVQQALGADSLLLAQLLWNRGYRDPLAAHTFLHPLDGACLGDPALMAGVPEAAQRILRALTDHERIAIYGDYDVDGVAGAALLATALRDLGGDVILHLPDRARDGYGVHPDAVRKLAAEGARVMVTVDCGISANSEVALARTLGLDVVVADHHMLPGGLPAAFAVLNPRQEICRYPYKELAGGGVAFQLARAILSATLGSLEADRRSRQLALFAALSTVADVVPLTGENRTIVSLGVEALRSGGSLGVRALVESAGRRLEELTAVDLSFRIIPRLNAAGRMGNARDALDLLLADDWDEAQAIAARLEEVNLARRSRVDELLSQVAEEAAEAAQAGAIVLHGAYPIGVAGLIATRLSERHGVPCVVIEAGEATSRGSARCGARIDLMRVLELCSEHLVQFGGHERAAGFTMPTDEAPLFRQAFTRAVEATGVLGNRLPLSIDGQLKLSSVGPRLAHLVERFEPSGAANPRPTFLSRNAVVRSLERLRGGHVRLQLVQDLVSRRALAFRPEFPMPELGHRVDVVYEVERSVWKGSERVDMLVRDLRPSNPAERYPAAAV